MTERMLQHIWKFGYYNQHQLFTTDGDSIFILYAGDLNHHQGPDFLHAKIRINDAIWIGNIELHLKSSDWLLHKHTEDANYKNIILHVVWKNDQPLQLNCPTLELQDRIAPSILHRYNELINRASFIPCDQKIAGIDSLIWLSWKDRLLTERLQKKSEVLLDLLKTCNFHWDEVFWWQLAKYFGGKVNAEAFESIAQTISLKVLSKHRHQIHQTEAILLGQAGLLNKDFSSSYPKMLKLEYEYLRRMYQFTSSRYPVFFLRMRPANFPSLRLAQLAMLLHQNQIGFDFFKQTDSLIEAKAMFNIAPNDYWLYHYRLEDDSCFKVKSIGADMVDHLFINAIIPFLWMYGDYYKDEVLKNKSLEWLHIIKKENNAIIEQFENLGLSVKNAADTQSLMELKKNYCDQKKCLDCAVGHQLLKNNI
jgi:hypothetical protein